MVLQAMSQHGDNIQMQCWGCAVLAGATEHSLSECARMVQLGGVEVILAALKRTCMPFVDSDESALLAKAACLGLASAASSAEGVARVCEADGIAIVVETLQAHRHSEPDVWETCFTVLQLRMDKDTCARAVGAGAVPILLHCLHQSKANVITQEMGIHLLSNLSADDTGSALVFSLGGVKCVVSAMEMHSGSAAVQVPYPPCTLSSTQRPPHRRNSATAGAGMCGSEQSREEQKRGRRGARVGRHPCPFPGYHAVPNIRKHQTIIRTHPCPGSRTRRFAKPVQVQPCVQNCRDGKAQRHGGAKHTTQRIHTHSLSLTHTLPSLSLSLSLSPTHTPTPIVRSSLLISVGS